MLDLIFNWQNALSLGVDVLIYVVMALVGTVLFTLRLAIALFFGDGGDMDVELDQDGAGGFVSLLSILAFITGAGWMGLTARIDWDLGQTYSALASFSFGSALMVFTTGLMYATRKLDKTIEYDLNTAVGKTGKTYLPIPAKGQGAGQVEVSVSGRKKVLEAISNGDAIASFESVRIVSVRDDGVFVVEVIK